MFHYLTEETLLKSLQDAENKVKDRPISHEWRGRNYESFGPLADAKLPVYIVAERKIREEKILDAMRGSGLANERARKSGIFYHKIFAKLYYISKTYVSSSNNRRSLFGLEGHLETNQEPTIRSIMGNYYDSWTDVKNNMKKLWDYESKLLLSRFYFFLSRYPRWSPGSIAEHVFCFRCEYQFDGSRMHLSENSEIDLYRKNNLNVVIDVKTGRPEAYHYLTVVGYALGLESCPGEVDRIDVGCIMYINFARHDPIPTIRCEFHPLLDSYRQDFVEELKEKISWYASHKEE